MSELGVTFCVTLGSPPLIAPNSLAASLLVALPTLTAQSYPTYTLR